MKAHPASRISPGQKRRLEARIHELGLSRERVKRWMVAASHGRYLHFNELSPAAYQALDQQLERFAERVAIEQST